MERHIIWSDPTTGAALVLETLLPLAAPAAESTASGQEPGPTPSLTPSTEQPAGEPQWSRSTVPVDPRPEPAAQTPPAVAAGADDDGGPDEPAAGWDPGPATKKLPGTRGVAPKLAAPRWPAGSAQGDAETIPEPEPAAGSTQGLLPS